MTDVPSRGKRDARVVPGNDAATRFLYQGGEEQRGGDRSSAGASAGLDMLAKAAKEQQLSDRRREVGRENVRLGRGIFKGTEEERRKRCSEAGKKARDEEKGIFAMDPSERSKMANRTNGKRIDIYKSKGNDDMFKKLQDKREKIERRKERRKEKLEENTGTQADVNNAINSALGGRKRPDWMK